LQRDTFFRIVNDYVTPKVNHEELKLEALRRETGPTPTAYQRTAITAQERSVAELRAFREEVSRVAPLWNPDLNDGVIINFAPLWRLVPQHRSWQKECKKVWDKLCKGDFDWAHLAMHLWPERVVPKCQADRSLAIAHGLEDEFWVEDDNGKWQQREPSSARQQEIIDEKTSSAVKGALEDLLYAPAPATRNRNTARRPRPRKTTQRTQTKPPRKTPTEQTRQRRPLTEGNAAKAILAVLESAEAGLGRSAITQATGISTTEWNRAIKALVASGQVVKTGKKRGTKYHLQGQGEQE